MNEPKSPQLKNQSEEIHTAAEEIISVFMARGEDASREHPEGRYDEILEAIEIRIQRIIDETTI